MKINFCYFFNTLKKGWQDIRYFFAKIRVKINHELKIIIMFA